MVTTDASGGFLRGMNAPDLALSHDRRETALAMFTDQALPGQPASAQWTLSTWDVRLKTKGRWSSRAKMRVSAFGWTTNGPTLYAPYFHKGKRGPRARIGLLAQPCGDLVATVRVFPFKPQAGKWTIYFSDARKLDRVHDAWISYNVRLTRREAAGHAASSMAAAPRRAGRAGH